MSTCPYTQAVRDRLSTLQGEANVMRSLLEEAHKVLSTLEPEDDSEYARLRALRMMIDAVVTNNLVRPALNVPDAQGLVDALRFYAEKKNWQSPSSGFVLQYDPEAAPIHKDSGQRASNALADFYKGGTA